METCFHPQGLYTQHATRTDIAMVKWWEACYTRVEGGGWRVEVHRSVLGGMRVQELFGKL